MYLLPVSHVFLPLHPHFHPYLLQQQGERGVEQEVHVLLAVSSCNSMLRGVVLLHLPHPASLVSCTKSGNTKVTPDDTKVTQSDKGHTSHKYITQSRLPLFFPS